MLIKCEHCIGDCYAGNPQDLKECGKAEVDPEYVYCYHLAEHLYRAVLDRLIDPENAVKGKFYMPAAKAWDFAGTESEELLIAIREYTGRNNLTKTESQKIQRIIEECGDVAAYLAAIIDAVKEEKRETMRQEGREHE